LEEKNKDITDSINYAQKIQAAILPSDAYIKSLLPEHFVLFKPKDIVSGDFYWFAEKDGRALAVAADCTGHGVPGAFMSMIGSSLLNESVIEKGITDPGKILQAIKDGVIKALRQTGGRLQQKDGMDMALCSFDVANKNVQYAGAYNPLIIVRNGEVLETRADRMPIGIYEDDGGKTFTTHDIQLQDGDSVYIYSDGFVDQFGGPKGKKFMSKRFKQALIDAQPLTMEEQEKMLDKLVEDWRTHSEQPGGVSEQMDDILVIGVRV
jgi:serine phosphatase RsbU (regulator of sigma subunit)